MAKKVINGKMYNTETAKQVGFYSNGGGWRDFHHLEETLYQKRSGEFFLFGEGGPSTCYAERVDSNSWSGGERIMPQTYAEAQAWAEEHLDGDEYEAIFGEVAEDDSRKAISVSLSVSAIEQAKRSAAQLGVNLSAYIESLILGNQQP